MRAEANRGLEESSFEGALRITKSGASLLGGLVV